MPSANGLQPSVNKTTNHRADFSSSMLLDSNHYYDQYSGTNMALSTSASTTTHHLVNTIANNSRMPNSRSMLDGFNYTNENVGADDEPFRSRNLETIPNTATTNVDSPPPVLIDTTDISTINNINRSNLQRKLFINYSMNPQKDTAKNPVSEDEDARKIR